MIKLTQPVKGILKKRPKGIITQFFGENAVDYKKLTGKDGHSGIDFATFFGDFIYATHSGTVIYTKYFYQCKFGGRYITIVSDKYPEGYYVYSYYGHLKDLLVKVGDKVSEGQKIATMGNTGACKHDAEGNYVDAYTLGDYAGTHLHFGIKLFKDPEPHTYQLNIKGKAYTLLNYNNGYRGNIDPLPYLVNNFMIYVINKKNEQFLLDENLKIAINIADPEELLKLKVRGLEGEPKKAEVPKDYLIYPGVEQSRFRDLLGL